MGLEDTPKHWTNWSPLVMTPHCHAPSCIREDLWNADTGEILCNMTAKYGNVSFITCAVLTTLLITVLC